MAKEKAVAKVSQSLETKYRVSNRKRQDGTYCYKGKYYNLESGKMVLLSEAPSSLTVELRVNKVTVRVAPKGDK